MKRTIALCLCAGLLFLSPSKGKALHPAAAIAGGAATAIVTGGGTFLVFNYLEKRKRIELKSLSRLQKELLYGTIASVVGLGCGALTLWLLFQITPEGRLRNATTTINEMKDSPLFITDEQMTPARIEEIFGLSCLWPLVRALDECEDARQALYDVEKTLNEIVREDESFVSVVQRRDIAALREKITACIGVATQDAAAWALQERRCRLGAQALGANADADADE